MSATASTPTYKETAQVAREIGVSVEALRKWERLKKIPAPLRTAAGRRLWTEGDIVAIRAMRGERMAGAAFSAA